jgi:four helix bundle protein
MSSSFQDLRVWQDSMAVVVEIYKETATFPKSEWSGLISQMRRAAVSVPSNIAEGKGLRTNKEFLKFLYTARGSLMELQTQVMIARELRYLHEDRSKDLLDRCSKVGRSLAGLINAIAAPVMETAIP